MLHFRTILHPTDFSASSEYAFHLACSLAADHHSKLVLLHVCPLPPPMLVEHDYALIAADEANAMNELEKLLPEKLGIDTERKVVTGNPVENILDAARQSDLIVMGTHGRSGVSRVLMGSVAEEVLRRAVRPVVTVRQLVPEAAWKYHEAATEAMVAS